MPQFRHQHRHDLTFFLLVMGGSLLFYLILGVGVAHLFIRQWAPRNFDNGHWMRWFLASFALLTNGTLLTFITACVVGIPLYFAIGWLIHNVNYRLYESASRYGQYVIGWTLCFFWPLMLYEAIYTGISLGYSMR